MYKQLLLVVICCIVGIFADIGECASKTSNCSQICNKTSNCSQICNNTIGSSNCSCRSGYKLNESRACDDVNECQDGSHQCDHSCINTVGSYKCACRNGFTLGPDKRRCIGYHHDCHTGREDYDDSCGCDYDDGHMCGPPFGYFGPHEGHMCGPPFGCFGPHAPYGYGNQLHGCHFQHHINLDDCIHHVRPPLHWYHDDSNSPCDNEVHRRPNHNERHHKGVYSPDTGCWHVMLGHTPCSHYGGGIRHEPCFHNGGDFAHGDHSLPSNHHHHKHQHGHKGKLDYCIHHRYNCHLPKLIHTKDHGCGECIKPHGYCKGDHQVFGRKGPNKLVGYDNYENFCVDF